MRTPAARLAAVAVGQVVSWGILYFALIVAARVIEDDTGWSLPSITLAFSAGLVVSAASGILVGRGLDAGGPRLLMSAGAVVGTVGLGIVASALDLTVFTAGMGRLRVGQSAVL